MCAMVRNTAKPAVDDAAKVAAMKATEEIKVPAQTETKVEEKKPAETPAVIPKSNVPAVATDKPVLAMADLQDQFIAGFGVLPRLKGSNGQRTISDL